MKTNENIPSLESISEINKIGSEIQKMLEKSAFKEIIIGGKTKEELISLINDGFNQYVGNIAKTEKNMPSAVSLDAELLMESEDFEISKIPERINLIRVSIESLGFKSPPVNIDEIYYKAEKLGLELCPAEVGPYLRLQYQNQPNDEILVIGMKPVSITNTYHAGVFMVGNAVFSPQYQWSPKPALVPLIVTDEEKYYNDGSYRIARKTHNFNNLKTTFVFVVPHKISIETKKF